VGAAIAAGSQLEKGICALLVKAARVIIKKKTGVVVPPPSLGIKKMDQDILDIKIAIPLIIKTSPTRLVRIVIIPALNETLF
jgi:hypothetical protein